MALYKVTVYKTNTDPYQLSWTNVYHVDALGINTALDAAENIAEGEKLFYTADTVIDKVSAQDGVVGGPIKYRGLNIGGDRPSDPGNLLPLFNTLRESLIDDEGNKNIKYYRGVLTEGDVAGGRINTDFLIDTVGPAMAAILATLGLRTKEDFPVTSNAFWPFVQMRQLSWQRRSRPGYHRGYVPDSPTP